MREYKIEQEAKRLIILMIISCKGFDEWKDADSKDLKILMEEDREVNVNELMTKLGGKSSLGFRLSRFAEENKQEVIDTNLVIKFFGGAEHIAHANLESMILKQKGEEDENVDKFIIGHIELPLEEIAKNGDTYEGVYRNGQVKIKIKGLIRGTEDEIDVRKNKKVICHFSLITDVNPKEEIVEWLKREQAVHKGFMDVAKRVLEVDYAKFWNLSNITREIVKELQK